MNCMVKKLRPLYKIIFLQNNDFRLNLYWFLFTIQKEITADACHFHLILIIAFFRHDVLILTIESLFGLFFIYIQLIVLFEKLEI